MACDPEQNGAHAQIPQVHKTNHELGRLHELALGDEHSDFPAIAQPFGLILADLNRVILGEHRIAVRIEILRTIGVGKLSGEQALVEVVVG